MDKRKTAQEIVDEIRKPGQPKEPVKAPPKPPPPPQPSEEDQDAGGGFNPDHTEPQP